MLSLCHDRDHEGLEDGTRIAALDGVVRPRCSGGPRRPWRYDRNAAPSAFSHTPAAAIPAGRPVRPTVGDKARIFLDTYSYARHR